MDEKQATNFILNRLRLGHNRQDIINELSQILGAPTDLVDKFVTKVAGSPPPIIIPKATTPSSLLESHEPYLEGEMLEEEFFSEEDLYQESEFEESPVISSEMAVPFEDTTKSDDSEIQSLSGDSPPQREFNQEELTAFVLNSIKKHQRHNDIVETVCQLTGMHWNEAQRFVARTQTQHHQQLSRSNRSIMVIFSAFFIIGGVLLMIWSALGLLDYYNAFTGQEVNTLPRDFIVLVIGAFISSIGIIAGGIFGLYRTLTNQ